jgi:hypothetical protein
LTCGDGEPHELTMSVSAKRRVSVEFIRRKMALTPDSASLIIRG